MPALTLMVLRPVEEDAVPQDADFSRKRPVVLVPHVEHRLATVEGDDRRLAARVATLAIGIVVALPDNHLRRLRRIDRPEGLVDLHFDAVALPVVSEPNHSEDGHNHRNQNQIHDSSFSVLNTITV